MEEQHIHEHEIHEKKMGIVLIFTIFAMIIEILLGRLTHSMSLLAEGYHMGVHVLTLGLTYIAYVIARKLRNSVKFPFGTYKIGILAGYTSALLLGFTGFEIMLEALERFIKPEEIQYTGAIYAAIFALIINFICIVIMEGRFHLHLLDHKDENERKDYNYRAAYYHILADVLVSVLTIVALVLGKYFGLTCLDSIAGIFGACLIIIWAYKLLKHTVKILVDMK